MTLFLCWTEKLEIKFFITYIKIKPKKYQFKKVDLSLNRIEQLLSETIQEVQVLVTEIKKTLECS